MKHTRKKSKGTWRHMLMLSFLLVVVVALILGAPVPGVWAQDDDDDDDGPIELDDSKIIIETNFTDGDAGIQVFLDGESWNKIQIKDPNGEKIFDVKGKGKLKKFGLTELFLESNEPEFGELALVDILALFPEGDYEFKGKTVEKDKLTGTATLSHDIPCAPENLSPSEETLVNGSVVTISWEHVIDMLDNAAETCTGPAITVETYQVIVENLDTENEFSIFLEAQDPDPDEVTLPAEFIEDDTTYKYEVLAIAENGNQTIQETWFCMGASALDLCPEPMD